MLEEPEVVAFVVVEAVGGHVGEATTRRLRPGVCSAPTVPVVVAALTAQTALVLGGAAFDVIGIVLVGAADVVPGLRRNAARLTAQLNRLSRWTRRKVLRRPKHVTHQASAAGAIALGGRVSAVTSTSAPTVEGKVDYLLRESERTQRRLNELDAASEDRRKEVEAELARLKLELVAHVDSAIEAALAEYASARRLGIACLGFALLLWTLAAFV